MHFTTSLTPERFEGDTSPSPSPNPNPFFSFTSSYEEAMPFDGEAMLFEEDASLSRSSSPNLFCSFTSSYEEVMPEWYTRGVPPESLEQDGNDEEDAIGFLNERFASFPDGENMVYVGLGDLDSGVGNHVPRSTRTRR